MNESFKQTELIVAIPSNNKHAILDSVEKAMQISMILERPYMRISANGTGLANVRQCVIDELHRRFPNDKYKYVLWIDSDIIIDEPSEKVAEYIKKAEEMNCSFAANYHSLQGNLYSNTVFPLVEGEEKPNSFSDAELKTLTPFTTKLSSAGMGLCYVKTPTDYEFHTKGHELEDWPFFVENRELIDLRYVNIRNRHQKWIMLPNEE